jgi:uncharacterized protein with FMN-binding domain
MAASKPPGILRENSSRDTKAISITRRAQRQYSNQFAETGKSVSKGNPIFRVTNTAGVAVLAIMVAPWTAGAVTGNTTYVADSQIEGSASTSNGHTAYANGTYTATGQYGSGPSFLTVTVALTGGVITQVEVKTPATNPISLYYQRGFATAVQAVVVGKPISEVKVGRLAGSSLTPDGFNAAIEEIRRQASDAN